MSDMDNNSKVFYDAFVKMIDFAKEHLSEKEFIKLIYGIYTYGIENVYITEIPVYENVEYQGHVLWKRIKSIEYEITFNHEYHESKMRFPIENKSIERDKV